MSERGTDDPTGVDPLGPGGALRERAQRWRCRVAPLHGRPTEHAIDVCDVGAVYPGRWYAAWEGGGGRSFAFGASPREAALLVACGRVPTVLGSAAAELELAAPGEMFRHELEAALAAAGSCAGIGAPTCRNGAGDS